jgi:hypothetical protein
MPPAGAGTCQQLNALASSAKLQRLPVAALSGSAAQRQHPPSTSAQHQCRPAPSAQPQRLQTHAARNRAGRSLQVGSTTTPIVFQDFPFIQFTSLALGSSMEVRAGKPAVNMLLLQGGVSVFSVQGTCKFALDTINRHIGFSASLDTLNIQALLDMVRCWRPAV